MASVMSRPCRNPEIRLDEKILEIVQRRRVELAFLDEDAGDSARQLRRRLAEAGLETLKPALRLAGAAAAVGVSGFGSLSGARLRTAQKPPE